MKPLIDVLDEMNLKEDKTRKMVVEKLKRLADIISNAVVAWDDNPQNNPDLTFVNIIMEDLVASPAKRITKLEIKECNKLWNKYKK